MMNGRIHSVTKIYPEEISIYVPKVPIQRDNLLSNIISNNKNYENDRSIEWLEKSINRTHRILKDYIQCNNFTYFFTLTISPDFCDRLDDKLVQSKVQSWLNNIRRHNSVGYIIVPERHKNGALHFHGLMSDPPFSIYDSGHKDSSNRTIYHTEAYKMGFHDFTEIGNLDAVSQYVRKYISKGFYNQEKFKKRFWASRNLVKPEIIYNIDMDNLPIDIFIDLDFGFYCRFGV